MPILIIGKYTVKKLEPGTPLPPKEEFKHAAFSFTLILKV